MNFRKLQHDATPIDSLHPVIHINHLTSFQLPGNNTTHTGYSFDTPDLSWHIALDYAGTEILEGATSQDSLLVWGCDSTGTAYYVSYSSATELTRTSAGIDVRSANDEGLDKRQ
jgi:hypothetical protein